MLQTCVVAGLFLSACAPTPEQLNATVTSIAADIFAAQTAVPTPTPTPGPIHLRAGGGGDYASLDKAVRGIPDGATVVLGPGTYRLAEPLDIDKPLRLVGAGMDQTMIVSAAEGYVICLTGDGPFVFEDITFRHDSEVEADVVVVQGGEVAFARCRFSGATKVGEEAEERYRAGLWIRGDASGLVQACEFVGNHNVGIAVGEQARPILEHNFCIDNTAVGIGYQDEAGGEARGNDCLRNGRYGISVRNHAQPTLERNLCADSGEAGVAYFEGARGAARQNECVWNGAHGIRVDDQAQPELEGNLCVDHAEAGIAYSDDASGVARSNKCAGNRVGIVVGNEAKPALEQNICGGNVEDGIAFLDSAGGMAYENECSENGRYGIYVAGTASPSLMDNSCHDNGEEDIRD